MLLMPIHIKTILTQLLDHSFAMLGSVFCARTKNIPSDVKRLSTITLFIYLAIELNKYIWQHLKASDISGGARGVPGVWHPSAKHPAQEKLICTSKNGGSFTII